MANTTSGTTTFDKTFAIDEIIEEAYERIGMQGVSGNQLRQARRSLNIMFQEWGNRGLHYWEVANNSITLVDGQAEYTMFRSTGDGTSDATAVYGVDDVLEAVYRNSSSVDSPLTKINRSTYQALSNKTSKGTPSQYFVQRFIDKVTITLYLTPGSTEAGNTINYYYVKRIQDVGDYTNATDVPYRFVPCMASGLAYYLSQKFKPELTQNMKLLYEDELQRALAEDGSSSSSYITPKLIIQMSNFSKGKHAQFISDRSGMAFPYKEMVKEWNGSRVHVSEFEPKQPQLQPKPHGADPQGLPMAKPDRTEPATQNLLPGNPFNITSGSTTITVTEPSHGRSTSDTVVFRNVDGSPGGVAFTVFENSSGFSITVTGTDNYTFQ